MEALVNLNKYIFKLVFNHIPTQIPKISAWDDENLNSTNKIFFSGTISTPKPLIIAYNSENFYMMDDILSIPLTQGGAENNRLKGDYSYKTFLTNEKEQLFGLLVEIPKDMPVINDSFVIAVDYPKINGQPRCILKINIGTKDAPIWEVYNNNTTFAFSSHGFDKKVINNTFFNKLTEIIYIIKQEV